MDLTQSANDVNQPSSDETAAALAAGQGDAPLEGTEGQVDNGIDLGLLELGLGDEVDDQTPENDESDSAPTKGLDFTDVIGLIEAGDKEAALARMADIGKGADKLARQAQQGNEARTSLANQNMMLEDVANGDARAAQYYASELLRLTGWTLEEVAELAKAGDSTPPQRTRERQSNPEIAELKAKLAKLESQTRSSSEKVASAQWMNTTGKAVVDHIASVTGRQYTPSQVWEATQFLKGVSNPTAIQIEDAIMRANPKYYREADNRFRESSKNLPAGTTVSPNGQMIRTKPADVMSEEYDRDHAARHRGK